VWQAVLAAVRPQASAWSLPWARVPRSTRLAPAVLGLYGTIVAIAVAGSLLNGRGGLAGGLAFLLLLPAAFGLAVAPRRPLDGWLLVTCWLVVIRFLIAPPTHSVVVLEVWAWSLWLPALLMAAWAARGRAAVGVVLVSVLALLASAVATPWPVEPHSVTPALVLTAIPLTLGAALGGRQRARTALRTEQARAEEALARQGALAERARIAREMHDVVAHHMSMIAVRCETAPYRLGEVPPPVRTEFADVAAAARQSLTEMQKLLGVLRSDDGAERAPQPGVDDLEELLAGARAAGADLQWGTGHSGRPAGVRPDRLPDRPAEPRQRRPARARCTGPGAHRAGRRRPADRRRQRPGWDDDGDAWAEQRIGPARDAGARRGARRDGRGGPDARRWVRRLRDAAPGPGRCPGSRRVIGVLVVDDQSMVREGFAALLSAQSDIDVLGTAGDGRESVETASRLSAAGGGPDVVLMDVRMPRLNGIEATRSLLSGSVAPPPKVLVLTTFDLDDHIYEALRAGASGFLLKHAPAAELLHAVRVVAAGDALLAPEITQRLIAHYLATGPARAVDGDRPARLAALTPRETEVLRLIARGLSNREIAEELFVVEQTAKTHVSRVLAKLALRDRAQAVVLAYETGLVRPGG
jgi:DNA-binding NarL/FixJ family response regulator/signal transduction histidine kinase